eukprot:416697-Lingulodinium_polyedra.AAC.1
MDEEVMGVFASLEAKRKAWAVAQPSGYKHFVPQIRGDAWCRLNVGVGYDCASGQARGQGAKAWCAQH